MEIEIKLSPVLLHEARALFENETFFISKPETLRMKASYLDTPERALLKSGFSFRERLEGDKKVFCLKRKLGGNLRLEIEAESDSLASAAELICKDKNVPLTVGAALLSGRLEPVFETVFTRKRANARQNGSTVEISFDKGEVVRNSRYAAISELELELKDGKEEDLKELSDYLCLKYGFKESRLTKAARGALLTEEEYSGMHEVSPFFIGSEMLNYCVAKGWIRYELDADSRLRYYLTPEGKEDMEKLFGIDFSKPCAEVK